MRVLSLYYTHKPGGFCRRLYRLLSAAAARGHQVHYLTLDQPPPELSSEVKVRLIPFPLQQRKGLFFWALFLTWSPCYVFYYALRIRPERLIAFGAFYAAVLAPVRFLLRARLVLFLRSLVFKIDQLTGKPAFIRLIARQVDRFGIYAANSVVCMTVAMKEEANRFSGKNLADSPILPNDAPPLQIPEKATCDIYLESLVPQLKDFRSEQTVLVMTSGVIDQRKNIGLLLDVFAELGREFSPSDVFLVVAGDGPLLKEHLRLARSLGIEHIGFAGWVSEMALLYGAVDLVVHPSIHEGMPNSLLEPLGAGLPVLAADIPELREMLEYEELLFSPDDPSELTTKIRAFLSDSRLLDEHRTNCAKICKKLTFDWDQRSCEIVDLT